MLHGQQNPAISAEPSENANSTYFFWGVFLGMIIQWITKFHG